MCVLFITALARVMPNTITPGNWSLVPGTEDFYMLTIGNYHLFAHDCIPDSDVRLKKRIKHAFVASWLDKVLSYVKQQLGAISEDELYVILHDKDILKDPDTDEGIYKENKLIQDNSCLQGKVKDGHIYLFQHNPVQEMSVALINNILAPTENNIEQAIKVIRNCTYET